MQKIAPLLLSLTLGLAAVPTLTIAGLQEGKEAYLRKDFGTAFDELLPAARDGRAEAQRLLGDMYWQGNGVAKNAGEAAKWLRLAAEQDHVDAMNALARLYVQGQGVAQDLWEAEKWFRRADGLSPSTAPASDRESASTPRTQAVLIGGETSLCQQIPPGMPPLAIQSRTNGVVEARLLLIDGMPKDVLILSGPRMFHESVRKAMMQYDCASVQHTTLAKQEFVFRADGASAKPVFTVKQLEPVFSRYPPAFDTDWRGLNAAHRRAIQIQLGNLAVADEPPYPKAGMGDLLESIRMVAEQLSVDGRLKLVARVGANGDVESLHFEVGQRADFNRYVAALVYQTQFKGAVCAGAPCAMDFPIHLAINRVEQKDPLASHLNRLKTVANAGDPFAQNELGQHFEQGIGTGVDLAQATHWYRLAAEQGWVLAQDNLGRMYEYGRGTEKNLAEALTWYRKAADQGSSSAQNDVADAYENGLGVAKDLDSAVKWHQRAAEQKNLVSIYALSRMYADGRGVPQNAAIAWRMALESAELGNSKAQLTVGKAYEEGKVVDRNMATATLWYRKAAAAGNKEAIAILKAKGTPVAPSPP